ncbi:MAG: hypothetical protein A2Y10_17580 [Planctomycetes bacterium GWF2_41_51]|nr:MAG: hypothetical protein A2Y10_17580 [Planctomycetes bacterium GWF2_41_51]HBG28038.1 hypothetical protein [Phycisphaerales bacterium]
MKTKERLTKMLNRQSTDRIPVDLWHTSEVLASLKNYYGLQDEFNLYKEMGLDKIVWVFMGYKSNIDAQVSGSQVGANSAGNRTMWGVPLKRIKSGEATYDEFGEAPLKNYNSIDSLNDYPYWPQVDKFEYEAAFNLAKRISKDFATIGPWVSLFEIYCQMRGFEQALMDLVLNPQLADAILDKIEQCQTKMMKRFFDQAADYLDLCFISDDMGTQNGLLISQDLWQRFFKDRITRWCELIHSYGIKVFYHTDGASEPLIGPLIEAGIDVLNPIQHICPGMEMDQLKNKYGNSVIFHGGVDNQSVLPFGTPADVRKEVQNCIETLGHEQKGYICCSCHNVQAGTPIENILTMIETVKKINGEE